MKVRRRISVVIWIVVAAAAIVGFYNIALALRHTDVDYYSDLLRQWRVSQYVRERVNPYPVAMAALETKYGTSASAHRHKYSINIIPRSSPHPDTRKDIGPPEATYPPNSAIVLAYTIGGIPPGVLLPLWGLMNVVLLLLCIRELVALETGGGAAVPLMLGLLALISIWPPTTLFFSRSQFSLIVLWTALVARRTSQSRPWLSGFLYAIALIKPSLGIPFLLEPIVRRRWRTLIYVGAIETCLLLASGWWLRASPLTLVSEWMGVSRYMLQGMYTVQEIIDDLHLNDTGWDTVISLLVLVAAGFAIRRCDTRKSLALVTAVSVLWTYHYEYDFVILLAVIAYVFVPFDWWNWDDWRKAAAIALLFVGLALSGNAAGGTTAIWHAARWAGRLGLIGLLVTVYKTRRTVRVDTPVLA